jgi:hypothetical protein
MSQVTNAIETWLEDPTVSWTLFIIFIFVFIPLTVFIFKLSIDVEYGPAKTHRSDRGDGGVKEWTVENTRRHAEDDKRAKHSTIEKTKKVGRKGNVEWSDEVSFY